jgi:2-haloacid dehalogenase
MAIEAVIYDIGNVLIEWVPEVYYDRVYGVEKRKRLFAEVDLHAMNLAVDAGGDFKKTIYEWADRHPEFGSEIRDWHDKWIELATPIIPHSLRLMRALQKRGVSVFALTNFGAGSFDYACTQYGFLLEFDRAYVSGRMKVVKPNPLIYQMVEADCGIAPENLLFVDDRPENIQVAAFRGWQVHQFDGPQAWADRLVRERLLTPGQSL